jgi:hypothetical protein
MGMKRVCDAYRGPGPLKCGKIIEDGTGGTITIDFAKDKEVYDLCDSCLRKFYRVINPMAQNRKVTAQITGS